MKTQLNELSMKEARRNYIKWPWDPNHSIGCECCFCGSSNIGLKWYARRHRQKIIVSDFVIIIDSVSCHIIRKKNTLHPCITDILQQHDFDIQVYKLKCIHLNVQLFERSLFVFCVGLYCLKRAAVQVCMEQEEWKKRNSAII